MNIFVCEDDQDYRRILCDEITDILSEKQIVCQAVRASGSTGEIIDYIGNNAALTLYFLNIDLNRELYGLEIAQMIREADRESAIVFITGFAGQAQLTFKYKLQALDYIVKGTDGLRSRIEDCMLIANTMLNVNSKKKLRLSGKSELLTIPLDDIYFLESGNSTHKISIHYRGGCYEGRGTLKEFFDRLDDRFAYCHRSFIVNKDNISAIDLKQRKISFENGMCCWYSKEYAKEVVSWARR